MDKKQKLLLFLFAGLSIFISVVLLILPYRLTINFNSELEDSVMVIYDNPITGNPNIIDFPANQINGSISVLLPFNTKNLQIDFNASNSVISIESVQFKYGFMKDEVLPIFEPISGIASFEYSDDQFRLTTMNYGGIINIENISTIFNQQAKRISALSILLTIMIILFIFLKYYVFSKLYHFSENIDKNKMKVFLDNNFSVSNLRLTENSTKMQKTLYYSSIIALITLLMAITIAVARNGYLSGKIDMQILSGDVGKINLYYNSAYGLNEIEKSELDTLPSDSVETYTAKFESHYISGFRLDFISEVPVKLYTIVYRSLFTKTVWSANDIYENIYESGRDKVIYLSDEDCLLFSGSDLIYIENFPQINFISYIVRVIFVIFALFIQTIIYLLIFKNIIYPFILRIGDYHNAYFYLVTISFLIISILNISFGDRWILGLVLMIVNLFLISYLTANQFGKNDHIKRIFVYAIPPLVYFLFCLLVFYPGLMNIDSCWQWHEMDLFRFMDQHPAMNGFFFYMLTHLWNSPAIISLTQIVIFSLLIGGGMKKLEDMGTPFIFRIMVLSVFILLPVNGIMAVTLWKDVLYSFLIFGLVLILTEIYNTRGEWLEKNVNIIIYALLSVLLILIRKNGVVILIFIFGLLPVFYLKKWKRVLLLIITALSINLFMHSVIYNLIHVYDQRSEGAQENQLKQKLMVQHIMTVDDEKTSQELNALSESELEKLWLSNLLKHPFKILGFHIESAQLALHLSEPVGLTGDLYGKNYYYFSPVGIDPNQYSETYGLKTKSLLPGLYQKIFDFYGNAANTNHVFQFLFLRPALYLYLSLIFMIIALVRFKKLSLILIFMPIIGNTLTYIIIPWMDHIRYMYPVMLMMPFYVGIALSKNQMISKS